MRLTGSRCWSSRRPGSGATDRRVRQLPVEHVVVGDLVMLEPGDQVIADGRLVTAADVRLDESSAHRGVRARPPRGRGRGAVGAFVVEGTGGYVSLPSGAESFAARLTGEARSFRHPRSPLEQAVNRLLYALVGARVLPGGDPRVLAVSPTRAHAHGGRDLGRWRREPDPGGSRAARRAHLCRGGRSHVPAAACWPNS